MKKMKDSGIEWIGQIPESWNVVKVKNVFYRSQEKAQLDNPIILSLARNGVKVRDITNNEGQLAESYFNYNPVIVGDLLLNPMDLYSGANCSYSKVEGVISPAYINLRKIRSADSRYYDYYFKCQYWSMSFFAHGKGVSYDNRWTMNNETLMNYYLPLPSYEEQIKIADILDKKCSQIDELIFIQEKEIEKLKKYKTSVITKAVTKGLDDTVPMKDSGVEWIGQIPESWNVGELKRFYNNRQEKYSGEDVEYFALENIESWTGKFIKTETTYDKSQSNMTYTGDVVFGKLRPYLAKTYHIENSKCCSLEFAIFYNKCGIKNKYLHYLMLSHWFVNIVDSSTYGTKMPRANIDFISCMIIPYPPEKTQNNICNFIEKELLKINCLCDEKQQKIEKLQQYKKSLIYEYVTGKKEV